MMQHSVSVIFASSTGAKTWQMQVVTTIGGDVFMLLWVLLFFQGSP